MLASPIRSLVAIAAVVVTGLVLAACGSDNPTGPSEDQVKEAAGTATQTPTTPKAPPPKAPPAKATTPAPQQAFADGKTIFTESCAGCHTLEAAGAAGQVGPNLDEAKPSEAAVETIVNDGRGGMPAFKGQLSPEEVKAVVAYVASSAGG